MTKTERILWWLDRWFWWTTNGWFAYKASLLMAKRTVIVRDPTFVKAMRVE